MSKVKLEDVIEAIKNNEFGKDLKKGEQLFILYQTTHDDGGTWQHGCMCGDRDDMTLAFATRMYEDAEFRSIVLDAFEFLVSFAEKKMRILKSKENGK